MRNWERPMVVVDTFAANEFVSTCGEQNRVYKFKCDAGSKYRDLFGDHYYSYDVYVDSNKNGQLDDRGDTKLGGYQACGKTHDAKTTDDFLNGFCVRVKDIWNRREVIPVVIWRGEDGRNIHCTTKLNMNEWTTERS